MDCLSTVFTIKYLMGFGLSFKLDGFRLIYAIITTVMWICSTMLSKEYFKSYSNMGRYYVCSAITYLATMGVFLSGDLYTTFCFFEIMSIASYVLVVQTETGESLRAGGTYLAVAVIGGLVMLMGVFMLYNLIGTLDLSLIGAKGREVLEHGSPAARRDICVAGALILFGFGAKAGMFPLHIWLPKAHPVAPAPASALLSGVLTKSGLFGVLVLTLEIFREDARFGLIIYILGLITMLTGAVLAVFSIDLKRTLACSSVSQIGFILVGVGLIPMMGEECTLAVTGSMLYMVNHSMFKLCLFLAAGAVYMKCHKLDLNLIRGCGREMKVVKVLFLIGAMGISGVPLFSGYISKTLIHEGIVEYIGMGMGSTAFFKLSEWLFLISGGMTASYMTKLFVAVFVEKNVDGHKPHDTRFSPASLIAIGVPAAVICVMGLIPKLFIGVVGKTITCFNTFALDHEQLEALDRLSIFSLENLKGSLISLSLGAVFYLLIRRFLMAEDEQGRRIYVDRWPSVLDIEELIYRPLILRWLPDGCYFVFDRLCIRLPKYLWKLINIAGRAVAYFLSNMLGQKLWGCIVYIGTAIAALCSGLLEFILEGLRRFIFTPLKEKQHPVLKRIYLKYSAIERYDRIVASTLSFGMLLITIGLCFTIFYLFYLLLA